MASLIPGYEYDIFISYRQNDNRSGWVTEFCSALQEELAATLKEPVSVYFDSNPQDGLLETHDVDKSLEGKLRCLIFIPVISQTYCDLNCFAWQGELVAFNKMAKEDSLGRDIRLASGNVASRILPVRIHSLDSEDQELLAKELGGVLRSVDFIYRSAGVNRPLRANEDHPQDNLNKTYYRDQINKVANAIKEILKAINKYPVRAAEYPGELIGSDPQRTKHFSPKFILVSFLAVVLITTGYLFSRHVFKSSEPGVKSIAVLPLENMSGDKEYTWFGDAMTWEIIAQLYKIKQFSVRSWTSVMQYKDTKKPGKIIGRELKVNYLLEGSAQKFEDKVRIHIQLISASTDKLIWSETFEAKGENIMSVESEIARKTAEKLQTVLTPEEKEQIDKTSTKNLEAYNSYLLGRFFWNKRTKEGLVKSLDYFSRSVAEDPDYAVAWAGLADTYCILAWWGWYPRAEGYSRSKEYSLQALSFDGNLAEAHATLGDVLFWNEWKWEEAGVELKRATELNPNYATAHQYYSEFLDVLGRNEEAREQIDMALELDPFSTAINGTSSLYFYNQGKYKEALDACNKTLELNADYIWAYWQSFYVLAKQGDDTKAAEALRQFFLRDTLTAELAKHIPDVFARSGLKGLLTWLIGIELQNPSANLYVAKWYAMLDKKEEALTMLEKAMKARLSGNVALNGLPDELPRVFNSPDFANLRSEPRFKAIIKKMGLNGYFP